MNQQTRWRRSFLTIAAGQTVSLIGSSAVQFSLIWWMASETSSPMMLALSGLFAFLPQLVLGPFAGVWIDRLKRKTIVMAADLFIGSVALGFAAFFLSGQPPYWTACLVLGIRAVGSVFHTPAIQSMIPMLVPENELVRANGWSQFMQSGAFMLGPVLGAAMYAALPLWLILATDFVGAVIACAAVAVVQIPEPARERHAAPHFFREMKEGAAVFFHNKPLLTITLAATVCMIFFLPLSSYYPLMTSSYFKASAWHAGLVELLYAAGMMASAFIISGIGNIRRKLTVSYFGLLGIGVTSLVCGLLPSHMWAFWIFAAVCAVMGASGNVFNIPYVAYMQGSVPPEAMGRAFSLIGSLMSLTMPIGLLISGPAAEKLGVPFWFLITGIATCATVLLSSLLEMAAVRKQK